MLVVNDLSIALGTPLSLAVHHLDIEAGRLPEGPEPDPGGLPLVYRPEPPRGQPGGPRGRGAAEGERQRTATLRRRSGRSSG